MELKPRLLIIDDDAVILELLDDIFRKKYTVKVLTNGEAALQAIEREKFDIIITDVKMPQISGIEILRFARERDPNALVIIMTGFSTLETTLDAIKYGAYDYITKPFQLDEIVLVVENAKNKVLLMRENQTLKQEVEELEERNRELDRQNHHLEAELKELRLQVQKRENLFPGKTSSTPANPIVGTANPYQKMAEIPNERFLKELQRINKLHDEGLISEDNFRVEKQRLLEQLK